MAPLTLLCVYSAALIAFSLLGGVLPQRIEMTHTRTQLAMSLVSGLMLGVAFFHLLPHAILSFRAQAGLNTAMGWVLAGMVVMLLLLRLLHFHHPDYLPVEAATCDHGHTHGAHAAADAAAPAEGVRWKGVLAGLGTHTFIDGVALSAAIMSTSHGHGEPLLGLSVFIAILLHKPLDAMSITALMKAGGASLAAQRLANLSFALICPAGALLFYIYGLSVGGLPEGLVAAALAFSAGVFICIALSDLLPEVHFHSHDRLKLTAVFLAGIAVSYFLATATPGHSHTVADVIIHSGG